jgi:glycosyltransferase involved in cell wall biosynthesis
MKIAIYHNLPSGGAKRTLYETLKRVSKRHKVDVYTLSTADENFCNLRPWADCYRVFPFVPLRLFHSPFGRLNQLQRWRDLQRLEALAQQIASEIDQHGYDLVYVQPSMWTQSPAVLSHLQTPTVYHVQEAPRSVYEPVIPRPYLNEGWREKVDQVDPFSSLYWRRFTELDHRNTVRATCLLANSRFTAETVQHIYGRQAEVAYFGVDNTTFRPFDYVEQENFVLSVGQLRPNKGFDFLIKALARLPVSIRPSLRIISNAGNGQERSYLTDLAAKTNVQCAIETMVDQERLVQCYNQATLLVYAPVREPFGLVPLEAMACGTPVVGVAEGGVHETVVDGLTGHLVDRDPAKFAEAVLSLLEDPRVRAQYGQQSREYVSDKWSWDKSVARIEQHLCSTAGQKCS